MEQESDLLVGESSAKGEKNLSELKALRASTKGSLTRIKNFIAAKGESLSATELDCRLEIFESYFKQAGIVQRSIERLGIKEEEIANDAFRGEIEEMYVCTKAKILERKAEVKGSSSAAEILDATFLHHQPAYCSRLEQIKLPNFSGKFSEYPNFIGLFKNLVDNNDALDNLQKFNYLKRCLSGAALGAVKEFELRGTNYRKALERLEKRFDNKCLIFQEHINLLLEVPKVSKATAFSLRNLEDSFNTHLTAMLSIGSYQDITNAILISLALDRVDPETQAKWQDMVDYNQLPSWDEFTKVLDHRCRIMEAKEAKTLHSENALPTSSARNDRRVRGRGSNEGHSHSRQIRSTVLAVHQVQCPYCKSNGHKADSCSEFQSLPVSRRFQETKRLMLCINCLEVGHSVRRCSQTKCSICSLPHHHLLHRFAPITEPNVASTSGANGEQNTSPLSVLLGSTGNQVVLATAVVEVRDYLGSYHPVRAILDSASQLNFVTEEMAQRLRLVKSKTEMQISGIGNELSRIKYVTQATCKSRISDFKTDLELLVIKNITDLQPTRSFAVDSWDIPKNIVLADPNFNKASKIDMLIGAECFFELLSIGQIKLDGRPTLQKTLFGWVVSGRYDLSLVPNASVCLVSGHGQTEDANLNKLVENFWKIERVESKKNFLTPDEERCEQHFLNTVERGENGRFVVKLPFKDNPEVLGESLGIAKKRFLSLEKRLDKNPEVKAKYCEFMEEYEKLGHMDKISRHQLDQMRYFCPHQCVLRPESSSTKLRVVFDCSCPTSSNISLNEVLLKGPVIQDSLFSIILRFRLYKYAITADIAKMYRQIRVEEGDRKYQCIVWRNKATDDLQGYQLKTVTYGTTSAPFQATRCLKMLADSNTLKFPLGAKVLRDDFYMDDLISGGDSAEEILNIYTEVSTILQEAGFELRKWWTNEKLQLRRIPENQREIPLRINDSDIIKTLGIKWNPHSDQLQYMVPAIQFSKNITKRVILAELSTLFDPLGLINPVIVKGKIIVQNLWVKKVNWDESVQARVFSEWELFRSRLKELKDIKIPRYVLTPQPRSVQIHGFADASLHAYGCCIYIRTVDELDQVHCQLLSAKSRVAPIKTESIPRLELCAAELLVALLVNIMPNLVHIVEEIFLWTDSEIVLCWLSAHPSTWEVFVANRVSKIQSELPAAVWKHVGSKQNPADIISRGAFASELLESRWFCGPEFLYLPKTKWPEKDCSKISTSIPGQRKGDAVLLAARVSSEFGENYLKYNDFQKVLRVFGYVTRWIANRKKTVERLSNVSEKGKVNVFDTSSTPLLSANILNDALNRILWHVQRKAFKEEIEQLENEKSISSKSCIKNLNPFLDTNSVKLLRVGGRLQNANIPYLVKCPILLPKSNLFVKNLVVYLHRKNYHAGPQALVAIIRQRFWVLDVRRLVKKVVDNCLHCFKYRPKLSNQIMGSLPVDRVQLSRPFHKTGVDFCGPFHLTLRRRGQRTYKAYVAVFVCFAVKAVHLEVVSDLSTQGFIAALKRFVARRGLCSDIFCDNGTNFVGARNELAEFRQQFLKQQTQKEIATWCAAEQIHFHHIPPRAPHFGGLWEAAVKSAKTHLFRTVGLAYLTFEELSTVVADIEAILNSRPLCAMSIDPSDEEVLTPWHFLIGAPLNAIVEPCIESEQVSDLKRWRRLSQIKQHFWARWSKEYLLELQKRTKWKASEANVKLGTLVLIADDNIPAQQWLMGKIVKVIASQDGKIRVVDIKTKNGILRRAIHRLAPLPIES